MQLEGLEFNVEGTSDSSAKSIQNLSAALSSLKSSLPGRSKIQNLVSSLESLNKVTGKMRIGTLKDLGEAVRNLSSAKVSASIAKNIEGIGLAARTITDDDVKRIQELSTALSGLQGIGSINVNIPGGAGNGTANNVAGVFTDIASTATQASGVIGSVLDTIKDKASGVTSAVSKIGHAFSRVGSVFKGIGSIPAFFGKDLVSGIKSATRSVGGLFAGLKRIAMYRMLRTAIKLFTEGLTTGLKNVYAYSQLVGTSFAHNMDLISTNALYAKNSLGAMAAPLIGALAPAIDFVTGKFVDLLNVVNMFIARLTGAETATIAKKTFSSWGDDANDAAGRVGDAVEKIKRTILGFDELNVLNAPNESGGGSGGGGAGGGADPGSMFEQVPIESGISEFADKLKEAFQNGEWDQVGTMLGEKFNEIVNNVPWADIGTTMGTGINAAIQIAYSGLTAADFVNLGSKFSSLFNAALTEINTETLGRLLVKKSTAVIDTLIGFVTDLNWGLLASKTSDFVIGVFNEISTWLKSVKWGDFTTSLYNNLKDAIANVKFSEIASAIFTALGEAIKALIEAGFALGENIGTDIGNGIKAFLEDPTKFAVDAIDLGVKLVQDGWTSLMGWFNDFPPNVKDAVANIMTGLKKTWTSLTSWFTSEEKTIPVVDAVKGGIKKAWDTLSGWFTGLKESIPTVDAVKGGIKKAWDTLAGWWAGLKEKATDQNVVSGLIKKGWGKLADWWKGLNEGTTSQNVVSGLIAKGWGKLSDWWKSLNEGTTSQNVVSGLIARGWSSIKDWWTGLDDKYKTGVASNLVLANIKRGWESISAWWSGLDDKFKTGVASDLILANIKRGWESIKKWWSGLDEKYKTGVASNLILANIKRGWMTIKKWWSSLDDKYKTGVASNLVMALIKKGWGTIAGWWKSLDKNSTVGLAKNLIMAMVVRGWTTLQNWFNGLGKQYTSAQASIVTNFIKGAYKTVQGWFNDAFGGGSVPHVTVKVDTEGYSGKSGGFAKGGAFYSGRWHSIPQYAAGGIAPPSHGSLFVAGEAGPEVVGHINGRSEVLNASQLASTMYDAVFSAMTAAGGSNRQDPVLYVTVRTENDEVLARAVTRGQRSLDARLSPT